MKYNQGWNENRRRRTRNEFLEDMKFATKLLVLAHLWFLVALGIFGCAGANNGSRLASELPLIVSPASEIGMPASLSLNIHVMQMGLDCKSQVRVMREATEDILASESLPKPRTFRLEPLSGSSLCGLSQSVVEPIGNPQFGARQSAKAHLTVYWSSITYPELRRAQTVLERMRAK
ncbi:MAG: hypothetical protein COU51_00140 [Parcubacteria group bacterium CG10_big_fil_rev_8_21_14_0_10_36_14]|nr:MAG: hypothetical protein COU51_00140 [Parcubacteria group bacterium CG10_big_fil_rev_8_21_14_0_10_36_14]